MAKVLQAKRKPVVVDQTLTIRQEDLDVLYQLRTQVKSIEETAKAYREDIARREAGLIAALKGPYRIEPGAFTAALKTHERRTVAWRQAFEDKLGKDAAAQLVNATPPTVTHEAVISKAST